MSDKGRTEIFMPVSHEEGEGFTEEDQKEMEKAKKWFSWPRKHWVAIWLVLYFLLQIGFTLIIPFIIFVLDLPGFIAIALILVFVFRLVVLISQGVTLFVHKFQCGTSTRSVTNLLFFISMISQFMIVIALYSGAKTLSRVSAPIFEDIYWVFAYAPGNSTGVIPTYGYGMHVVNMVFAIINFVLILSDIVTIIIINKNIEFEEGNPRVEEKRVDPYTDIKEEELKDLDEVVTNPERPPSPLYAMDVKRNPPMAPKCKKQPQDDDSKSYRGPDAPQVGPGEMPQEYTLGLRPAKTEVVL